MSKKQSSGEGVLTDGNAVDTSVRPDYNAMHYLRKKALKPDVQTSEQEQTKKKGLEL